MKNPSMQITTVTKVWELNARELAAMIIQTLGISDASRIEICTDDGYEFPQEKTNVTIRAEYNDSENRSRDALNPTQPYDGW